MIKHSKLVLFILLPLGLISCVDQRPTKPKELPAPNILMVLIDDLGYTDLGVYGGSVSTPNIDALSQLGTVYSNAYAYPSCAPSRAALLTGKDPHQVGLGSQNGLAPPGVSVATQGYKGSLEGEFVSIANILKQGGYTTYQVGKWHLGDEPEQSPRNQGFDYHFSLMDGAASHYGDMLTTGDKVNPSGMADYSENGEKVVSLPEDFYSTQFYTQWLIDALAMRDQEKGKPFFAYLAYTAMHDPMHAPQDRIAKYLHQYDDGFEVLKNQRIENLLKRGLVSDVLPGPRWLTGTPAWGDLTPIQQKDLSHRMAVYAAMLDYLDEEIGRLMSYLKKAGEYENTLVVIMSDNGAASAPRTFFANSPQNIAWQDKAYPLHKVADYGKRGSYQAMGNYNAQAVSGPYFGFKTSLYEGGVRVPMIIKPPGIKKAWVNNHFVSITDLYQTFADYGDVSTTNQQDLLGCSLRQSLQGNTKASCHPEFGMAYMGWRAYWQGDWKLVFVSKTFGGTGQYALYNLKNDPGETLDLSSEYPEKLEELSLKWQNYAAKQEVAVVSMSEVNNFFDRVSTKFFETNWGD